VVIWLYALILLVLAVALWGAYKVLGTPSRLEPGDYRIVLDDLTASVEKAAAELRGALDGPPGRARTAIANQSRKIFQTGYFQTLRLRPLTGRDPSAEARAELGRACEAYDWAARMVGSDASSNPLILDAARRLVDAGDAAFRRALLELPPAPIASRESTEPSS
jgi:hypothetical protein